MKPKPTALKVLEGNPGHHPLPQNEPKPDVKIPGCPGHLDSTARKEWHRIAKELEKLGLVSEIDRSALAAYCCLYSRWAQAEKKVKEQGLTIVTQTGNLIQNPHVGIANTAMKMLRQYLIEFGFTPASRSRIQVSGGSPEDELEELLGSDVPSAASEQ